MLRTPAPLIGALGGTMKRPSDRLVALERLFDAAAFYGIVAEHKCPDCDELRSFFAHKSWTQISVADLSNHDGDLPLLTPEAYRAFFPAWIRAGLNDPEGSIATMALINMEATDLHTVFSPVQRRFLVECAVEIHNGDQFAIQDAECRTRIRNICSRWAE